MTDDFKKKLLKYLTGNIQQGSGTNTPLYQPVETITNNLETHIWDNYGLSGRPYLADIIKSNQNDNYLCYGIGRDTNNGVDYQFGFMIVLDSNFQILQSTREYTSGTEMAAFLKICQNAKGTFYGIDYNSRTNVYRFILLNNVLMKPENQQEYRFTMQKTYNITSNYPQNFTIKDILKNPNGGEYLIYGFRTVSSRNRPCAIEYTINVGTANEWVQYDYTSSDNAHYNLTGGWANWDTESNLTFRLIGGVDSSTNTQVRIYSNSTNAMVLNKTYNLDINTSGFGAEDGLYFTSVILSENNAYVLAFVYGVNNQAFIYRINNNSIKKIYTSDSFVGVLGNVLTIGLKTDYINTYFWYLMPIVAGSEWSYYGGLIMGDNVYNTLIKDTTAISQMSLLNGYNQYNLYSITIQSGDNLYKMPFVFNQYNYNGLPYENINSLVPNSGRIYDSNGDIIFARNLYNKSINGATTVSTIEVPNTFLNDITIQTKELWGETGICLAFEALEMTKNIYENLNINFFNTLVMKNSNDPNNEIINNPGASRLNSSASGVLDYTNAKASKIRINYQDGSSIIQNIGTPTITNDIATYEITIHVNKAINNIEILSNDTNTSYQTITGNFDLFKEYTITQDVRVE